MITSITNQHCLGLWWWPKWRDEMALDWPGYKQVPCVTAGATQPMETDLDRLRTENEALRKRVAELEATLVGWQKFDNLHREKISDLRAENAALTEKLAYFEHMAGEDKAKIEALRTENEAMRKRVRELGAALQTSPAAAAPVWQIIQPHVFLNEIQLVIEWPGKLIVCVNPTDTTEAKGCGAAIRRGDHFVSIMYSNMDEIRRTVTASPVGREGNVDPAHGREDTHG